MSACNHLTVTRSQSTWSVASYGDIVHRFQQEVETAEANDCYEDALSICLKSMRSLESVDVSRLSDEQKLELRFHHGQALLRSQFLFDSIMLSNMKFAGNLSSTLPNASTAFPSSFMSSGEHPTTNALPLPCKETFGQFLDCGAAEDETDEDDCKTENESAFKSKKSQDPIITQRKTEQTRLEKEEMELRKNIMETVVKKRMNLRLSDVVGLEKAKTALQDAVVVPLMFPNSAQAKKAWTGILLYGPSGVGKTRLIQALAAESEMNFMCVDSTSLLSKWQGESTKNVKALFNVARELSPCIVFLDECDALCGGRETSDSSSDKQIKTQFLTEMDGFATSNDKRVVVIGNTNLPGSLDGGFLRRFMRRVYVDLPTETERQELLELNLKDYNHDLTKKDLTKISKKTDKFSGHDILTLVTAAGMEPCREVLRKHGGLGQLLNATENVSSDLRNLTMADFNQAIKDVTPTNDDKFLNQLKPFKEKWENAKCAAYEENQAMNERMKKDSWFLKAVSIGLRLFD